jgi:hypothetical protein
LRGVIPRLARELNDTSTGEGLTPTQYSVLALVRHRGPLGLAELTWLVGYYGALALALAVFRPALPESFG